MLHLVRSDGTVLSIRNLMDQVYCMEDEETGWLYYWSASEGLRIAEARGEVFSVSLSEMGVTAETIRRQYHDIDETYALTTDLSRPLLFVPFRDKCQLIDGWHRLLRAALTGVDVLLAYFLTQEEADSILVCKLPPEQNVGIGEKVEKVQPSSPAPPRRTLRARRKRIGRRQ